MPDFGGHRHLTPLRFAMGRRTARRWAVYTPGGVLGREGPGLPGCYRLMAMATGSLPTVMALPGLPVAVLTGVTLWLPLPA